MTKLEVIELIVISVAIVIFLAWFVIKSIKNKWISKLVDTVNLAIKDAETNGWNGKVKKAYVLQKVEEKCKELKIPYSLLVGLISKLIDTVIKHYNIIAK